MILGAFVAHQRRLRGPRRLRRCSSSACSRQRTFSAGLLAQLVFWCGQASFFLVLALYLQQGRGLSALARRSRVHDPRRGVPRGLDGRAGAGAARTVAGVLAAGALVLAAGTPADGGTVADVGTGGSVAVLVPGLLLIGAGMGLGIAPLATIILSSTGPEHAGAASGVLSTMQNVGNALGVAVIGVIYFGALHSGLAGAFQLSLAALAAILIGVAALTRLLPAPAAASSGSAS